jgi:16S rRNA (uracil1498-N3)-methyltransferase
MGHERRIFLESEPAGIDTIITLPSDNSHYIMRVLRLARGDRINVVHRSNGAAFIAEIVSNDSPIRVRIIEEIASRLNDCPISSLAVALCKGSVNDTICERATEVGVRNVVMWQAERSVSTSTSADWKEKKVSRWQRIAESACKQCSRDDLPSIYIVSSLQEALELCGSLDDVTSRTLACSLAHDALPIEKVNLTEAPLHLLIGPEGDFTESEEGLLRKNQITLLSLSNLRLRVETAATVALGVVIGARACQASNLKSISDRSTCLG